VSHIGGFGATLRYRVHGIRIWVDGESTESQPTRRYAFMYAPDTLTQESLLQSVHLYDRDNQTLRPTTFNYYPAPQTLQGTTQNFTTARANWPLRLNVSDGTAQSDLLDITGDGRPDWVECAPPSPPNASLCVHPNLGNGQFGAPQTWTATGTTQAPVQCAFHHQFHELLDINGDGRPDWVKVSGITAPRVFLNTGSGFTGPVPWSFPALCDDPPSEPCVDSYEVNPAERGGIRDLNGDGLPDFIDPDCDCQDASGNAMYCPGSEGFCRVFFNTGSGFDTTGTLWSWPLIDGEPGKTSEFNANSGTTTNTLADMTGDGLPDLVLSEPEVFFTGWEVYVNTGSGFAVDPLPWTTASGSAPALEIEQACGDNIPPYGWPNPIGLEGALRDMNGDGLPDYVDANTNCPVIQGQEGSVQVGPWNVWINNGSGFNPPVPWAGTDGLYVQRWGKVGDSRVVAGDILDFNGDGVAD
jgi:hypothetical protein